MEKDRVNILIVGAGKGGKVLVELLHKSKTVNIVGVIDIKDDAPGVILAKKLNIPTAVDFREFLEKKELNEIVNTTGRMDVQEELLKCKSLGAEVIGGHSAKLMWTLIEEYRETEEILRASENKYRVLVENLPQKIFLRDKNSTYISCNENYARDLKIKAEEITGKTDYDFYSKELSEKYRKDDKRIMESGRIEEDIEEKYIQNGQKLTVHTVKTPVRDENGNTIGVLGIFWDITEREKAQEALEAAYQQLKATQQQLIQTGKMATMGQLAAGISHELNQPLTGIKGFAQAVLMDLEKESPFRNDLNKIVGQVDRMDTIIKNVRFFARKSDFKIIELDINHVISDSLMLLSQQLKVHNIRLIQELGSDIPKIQGDPNQLQQAFLNLISNARDAILSLNRPEGGEIRIQTSLSQDKDHIEITFQDTGCGISEGNLQQIFSPFFTTKSPDKGVGLGLSITYRIIENHQGKISFQSKEGQGTTFNITLPLKITEDEAGRS